MNLINAREVLVAVKLLLRVSDSMVCSSQYRSLVQYAVLPIVSFFWSRTLYGFIHVVKNLKGEEPLAYKNSRD